MINFNFTQEDSAFLVSDSWKLRLSLVKKDFVRFNNTMKTNLEKLIEENEEDFENIEKHMTDIFQIQDFIDEIDTMITKIGRYPLSLEHVERITFFEREYYTRVMTPQIFESLSEEVRQEERINSTLNEVIIRINEMWDNNETEDNMKKYLHDTIKTVYTNYTDDQLNHLTNVMFNTLTSQKPVRVNLSEEQINNLERKRGLTGICGTCLENYNEDDEVIALKCGHNFHPDCIIPWLKRSVKCPNCRTDLR